MTTQPPASGIGADITIPHVSLLVWYHDVSKEMLLVDKLMERFQGFVDQKCQHIRLEYNQNKGWVLLQGAPKSTRQCICWVAFVTIMKTLLLI